MATSTPLPGPADAHSIVSASWAREKANAVGRATGPALGACQMHTSQLRARLGSSPSPCACKASSQASQRDLQAGRFMKLCRCGVKGLLLMGHWARKYLQQQLDQGVRPAASQRELQPLRQREQSCACGLQQRSGRCSHRGQRSSGQCADLLQMHSSGPTATAIV